MPFLHYSPFHTIAFSAPSEALSAPSEALPAHSKAFLQAGFQALPSPSLPRLVQALLIIMEALPALTNSIGHCPL